MVPSNPRRPHVFGMITTAASCHYTPVALRSFFAHTPFASDDRFILIDNDANFELPPDVADRVTLVRPAAPQGFATNANLLLGEAEARGADLFLMNNDLVFTPGWLDPLAVDRPALLSPLSNGQLTRSAGAFTTQPLMDLADYLGFESNVETIGRQHGAESQGYTPVPSLAFFCIKIPASVYAEVGTFDERFGKGGGEDRDYAIRAWMAGIPQEYALGSWVLHFQGKSTWRGGETPEQQAQRDLIYTQAFQRKWGAALTYALIGGDWNLFRTDPKLAARLDKQDFPFIVRYLGEHRSIDRYIQRQQQARVDAVCCIYDDDSWLAPTIASVYDACERIWFLVGEQPWNGIASDQTELLARIHALADPAGKIRVVRGEWADEATQRNAGLQFVREDGADYCLIIDADEIYDPLQLDQALTMMRQNPEVDCWRASCLTYWKSFRYRVDPPEAFAAPVVVRVGTGRFTENRQFEAPTQVALAPDALVFHHMSYARTDAQILRKITTFGHARDVVPGWYEQVWKQWDSDRTLQNLNPCWPGAYQRIVEQPYEALPAVLQRMWDDEEQGRKAS